MTATRTSLSLAAGVLLSMSGLACSEEEPRTLVLLHTNDEHSHLLGGPPEADDFPTASTAATTKGGIARRATVLDAERAKAASAGAAVLTVSAGDNSMGTLAQVTFTTASPDYRLMKLLGYDVTTFGNHEFDFAPAGLAAAISAAKASTEGIPQIVATNIHFSDTSADDDSLAALYDSGADPSRPVHKSLIVTASNGLRVGFVGLVGANAATLAPLKTPVTFSKALCCDETDIAPTLDALYAELTAEVKKVRAAGVDVVVALSHSGVDVANPDLGEDTLIAKNVSGLDVIVSGHSHTSYPAKLVTSSGRTILVQQAGRFGDTVGKITLRVTPGQPIAFDLGASALIPVDGTVAPRADISTFVSNVYDALEKTKIAGLGKSFLEYSVGVTVGNSSLADDASVVGDLAFKPVAKNSFKVDNSGWQRETQLLVLAADSVLAGTEALAGPTDLGVEAAGVLRGDLTPTAGGALAFADIFNVVPLGISPVAHTPGTPMARFGIALGEIKAAFEVTAGYAYTSETNGDFYLVPSGFCFKYDLSRKMFDSGGSVLDPTNGRVTEIRRATNHANIDTCDELLYSTDPAVLAASPSGFLKGPLTLYTATANLYIVNFAYVAGVSIKNPSTGAPYASIYDAILYRDSAKTAEVKEWESLGSYVAGLSPASGTGSLPARYQSLTPANCGSLAGGCGRRAVCFGAACH